MRDKRKKFTELAEKRVNRALNVLRLVGNLSNKSNYQYSDQDVRKILSALEAEVKEVRRRFLAGDDDKSTRFQL